MDDDARGLASLHHGSSATANPIAVPDGAVRRVVPRPAAKGADFYLATGLEAECLARVELLLDRPIRLRKGNVLYRAGDRFNALYAIRTGSSKSVLLARNGQEQVTGYHMAGDAIGTDGIGTGKYACQATALEDIAVCRLPFEDVESLARSSDQFRHNLYALLCRENARAQMLMIVLGTMRAEQRLAVYLLDLSGRHQACGYSSCEFVLRMSRREIGSYLGLTLETVSRLFSQFTRDGLIQVGGQGRTVKFLDRAGVSQLVDGGRPPAQVGRAKRPAAVPQPARWAAQ
jgi:CRP/FNR family transcriptional regulator